MPKTYKQNFGLEATVPSRECDIRKKKKKKAVMHASSE